MIALRLLGPVDLRGADGRVLRSALALPKRIALLAYLAAARPTGFHARDSLVGLLWPECAEDRARAALRQSVYALRRALDEDVLIGCGDAVLGVDPARVWCDVTAFEDAAAAQDDAKALDLYRGELLQGFHISGVPEFERWVERTRQRLGTTAAASARTLADTAQARGDDRTALHWTRRVLDMRPDDECALRRMIGILVRMGDRTAAIHAYEDFRRRLQMDYGLEPSVQTRELIATGCSAMGSARRQLRFDMADHADGLGHPGHP
jgi:DNA-binding SARP family transcriptional activator